MGKRVKICEHLFRLGEASPSSLITHLEKWILGGDGD
jgi:hypothetical protein